jgi:hypothetical protein
MNYTQVDMADDNGNGEAEADIMEKVSPLGHRPWKESRKPHRES